MDALGFVVDGEDGYSVGPPHPGGSGGLSPGTEEIDSASVWGLLAGGGGGDNNMILVMIIIMIIIMVMISIIVYY